MIDFLGRLSTYFYLKRITLAVAKFLRSERASQQNYCPEVLQSPEQSTDMKVILPVGGRPNKANTKKCLT